jgi:hypothetical protein
MVRLRSTSVWIALVCSVSACGSHKPAPTSADDKEDERPLPPLPPPPKLTTLKLSVVDSFGTVQERYCAWKPISLAVKGVDDRGRDMDVSDHHFKVKTDPAGLGDSLTLRSPFESSFALDRPLVITVEDHEEHVQGSLEILPTVDCTTSIKFEPHGGERGKAGKEGARGEGGQNGGDGGDAGDGTDGPPGGSATFKAAWVVSESGERYVLVVGKPDAPGSTASKVLVGATAKVTLSVPGGRGGYGGRGGSGGESAPIYEGCKSGIPGNGGQGGNGGNGADGGKGGNVTLKVTDKALLDRLIVEVPGGSAGAAGEGGRGGDPGRVMCGGNTDTGNKGATGSKGRDGSAGPEGSSKSLVVAPGKLKLIPAALAELPGLRLAK